MQYVSYTPLLPLNIYFLSPHSTTPSLPFRSNFKSRAPFTHLRHTIRIESNVLEKRAIYTSQFGTRLRNVSGTLHLALFHVFGFVRIHEKFCDILSSSYHHMCALLNGRIFQARSSCAPKSRSSERLFEHGKIISRTPENVDHSLHRFWRVSSLTVT